MKTAEEIVTELTRRIASYRLGAATYPELDGMADELEGLLRWIIADDLRRQNEMGKP